MFSGFRFATAEVAEINILFNKSFIYCLYNLQHIKAEKPEDSSEDLDMEIVDTSDRMTCFVLFRKFIKEVNCIFC